MEKLRESFAGNKDKGEKQGNTQEPQKVIAENSQQSVAVDSKVDDEAFNS